MPYHSTIGCVLPIAMSEWGDGVVLLTIIDLTITAEEMLALLGNSNITLYSKTSNSDGSRKLGTCTGSRSTGTGTSNTGTVYSS